MDVNKKKYKLGRLAKDFGVGNKYIIEILLNYGYENAHEKKLSHSTSLNAEEVNVVFTYILEKDILYVKLGAMDVAIIEWSDEDYYVELIEKEHNLDRNFIVSLCSNEGAYFCDYDEAEQYAIEFSKQIRNKGEYINIDVNCSEFICEDTLD